MANIQLQLTQIFIVQVQKGEVYCEGFTHIRQWHWQYNVCIVLISFQNYKFN
jgi:hypothetical protein